jgi:hypothetical protein
MNPGHKTLIAILVSKDFSDATSTEHEGPTMVDHLECARILGAKATVKSGRGPQVNGGRLATEWTDRANVVLKAYEKVFSNRARSLRG